MKKDNMYSISQNIYKIDLLINFILIKLKIINPKIAENDF